MDTKRIPKKLFWGIGFIIVILLIFQAGVFVGFHKAGFGRRFGERFPGAHGNIGQISQIIRVASSTPIIVNGQKISVSDLQPGETLIVIGAPSERESLKAKFIRVVAPPTR